MESGIEASTPMENFQSTQTESNGSGVVTGDGSELQHTPPPDPRWPYLGRWSSSSNRTSPASAPSPTKDAEASHVTTTDPPAVVTTTDTHAAVTADPSAATADPPAVVATTNPHAAATTSALVSSTTELHVDPTSAIAHLATESTTPNPLPNTALPIASEPTDLLLGTVDVHLSSEKTLDSLTQAGVLPLKETQTSISEAPQQQVYPLLLSLNR
ncbi:hypothetical protein HA466_0244340 [Hirschfeldia incana]|nr:hypothetical protein HA466_0244340 [Hirschfeldia incana]